MNAPFRDLLASHSLFANSEWDERRVIIDLMRLFSNHALYNVIQNLQSKKIAGKISQHF
jgi:hypothetical protein